MSKEGAMTTREAIAEVLGELPEERLAQVLDFARFLNWQEERDGWHDFGRAQLARAYGPDEPNYTLDDLKSSGEQ
jgi:hypothetical protein